MANKLKYALLACVFFLSSVTCGTGAVTAPPENAAQGDEPEISMDFQDARLKDILKLFSIQSGLNFIASEGLQDRKITLYLDKVPLRDAMSKLFSANNLSYELDKGANIFIVKDLGKPVPETVTKVFYLKYAAVSSSRLATEMDDLMKSCSSGTSGSSNQPTTTSTSQSEGGSESTTSKAVLGNISGVIKKILSENGTVIEDARTNSLIVTDTPLKMAVVEKVIAALDKPLVQVMLEVEMLDVSKNIVDKLGFKFGSTPLSVIVTGASAATGFPFGAWDKIYSPARGSIGIDSSSTYSAQLDWLRTDTDTKYLARPKILTLNNQTAEIKITTQETIGITTTNNGTGSAIQTTTEPERAETGVGLRVTPQVNLDTGEVTMFIVPTVKDATTSSIPINNSGTNYYKDPEERTTKSTVRVKDGETVVLGGLIRNEKSVVITKLPVLGDLPFVGAFFRHKDQTKGKERELLVFITPRVIKEAGITGAAPDKPKPIALPEREQGAVSLAASRQKAINSYLNNFEASR
jgi:type IV pilus assembly protein PilQ